MKLTNFRIFSPVLLTKDSLWVINYCVVYWTINQPNANYKFKFLWSQLRVAAKCELIDICDEFLLTLTKTIITFSSTYTSIWLSNNCLIITTVGHVNIFGHPSSHYIFNCCLYIPFSVCPFYQYSTTLFRKIVDTRRRFVYFVVTLLNTYNLDFSSMQPYYQISTFKW